MTFLTLPALSGIHIFGFTVDAALFAFFLVIAGWGLLNLLEFRRFD